MHLVWGVIVVFGAYFTRADVRELQMNERAYLPPDNKEYLPPAEKKVTEVVNSQCILPMIVYNGRPPVKLESKLKNEHMPPSKEEGKILATKINNQPIDSNDPVLISPKILATKVNKQPIIANDAVPITPKLQEKHIIKDSKSNPTKVLDNNLTVKPKQVMNREYLPPSNDDKHTKAIAQNYQHNQPKAIPDPLPISQQLTKIVNATSYQHNKPKAIDDPLPIKVNYIQPLRLDFLDGQLKPIAKGPLFTGLFLNASEIKLSTERVPKKMRFNTTQALEVKQNMKPLPLAVDSSKTRTTSSGKEAISQKKEVNYELNSEHSLQNKKYHKKFEDDIVLINYPDATTNFKLFNSDDDSLLSGSAPEVIFKPGDDISFVHDTSIIDDYEHIPAKAKKAETFTTTTTTTTSTTPIPLPLETYTTTLHDHDQDAQAALAQQQSNENESSVTDHGYSYEKPKYESIAEQTTEALRRQADECGVTDMEQPNTEIRENKPLTNEQPIKEDALTIPEYQSHENDNSHTGAGYFYEKPKIPFDF